VPTDFLLLNQNQDILNKLQIEIGPAKTQILIKGIDAIIANGIPLWKLIICLMVEDCGITISKQFAKYYTKEICEIDGDAYDFKGLTKSVIEELKQNESKLSTIIGKLHASNIFVKFPEKTLPKTSSQNEIFYVMTGSPKEFGFKTKSDFQKTLPDNWTEQKGLDKNTNYLISDDVLSKSSKTAKANKLGIQIVTYDIDPTNI
jgi:NAD-dependent DNA ligase